MGFNEQNRQDGLKLKHPDLPTMAHGVLVVMVCIGLLYFIQQWVEGVAAIILANLLYVLVPVWACYMFRFDSERTLFLRSLRLRGYAGVLLGCLGGVVFILVLSTLLKSVPALAPSPDMERQFADQVEKIRSWGRVWYFLILAVLIPVSEEILFRAFLLRSARETLGIVGSLLVTALFFGVLHRISYARMILMFLFGLYLGVAVWESRSILASGLIHSLYNGFLLVMEELSPTTGAAVRPDDLYEVGRTGKGLILVVALFLMAGALYLFRQDRREAEKHHQEPMEDGALYTPLFGP